MRIAFDTRGNIAPIGYFRVAFLSVSKQVFVRNHSHENEFLYRFSSMKTEVQDNKMAHSIGFIKQPNNKTHEQGLSKVL